MNDEPGGIGMQHVSGTVVRDGATVEQQAWQPLAPVGRGVSHKVLWQSGDSIAGVMRLEVDGRVDEHVHRRAHHHLWVLEGMIEVLGQRLGPGSYVHIPAGVTHGMVNQGTGPAVFHYLYLQPQDQAAAGVAEGAILGT
jgi:quercetin dioxygenase-like cupin family protein